jgi:hypothetical protein
MDASVEVRRVVANRLLALSVSLAAVLAGAMPALSADLKDPLTPLTSAESSMLCFRRDYSPEHLAQHPKQTTKSVLLAFQQGYYPFQQAYVTVVVTPRTGAPKRIAAGCIWSEGANSAPLGRKLFANFDKPAAFGCMVPVPNTDREGGYFLIDPAQDAKSLSLFLQSPITTVPDKLSKTQDNYVTLGPEDDTFTLTRIEPKACASFKAVRE